VQNDNDRLQTFINMVLGEVWEVPGEVIEENLIERRREPYRAQVPNQVLVLTMGVDVHDDRLEYCVMGYGRGKESWGIEYGKIYGDPRILYDRTLENGDVILSVWTHLDMIRQKDFMCEDGTTMRILRTCVDSGYISSSVYQYTIRREPNVFATKGIGGFGKGFLYTASKTKKENATLQILGVDTGKDTLFARLKINYPGAGYCHFPINEDTGFNEEFFQSLMNEKRVRIKNSKGFWTYAYVKVAPSQPNEALDTVILAMAAMEILNPPFDVLAEKRKIRQIEQPAMVDRSKVVYTENPPSNAKPAYRLNNSARMRPNNTGSAIGMGKMNLEV
jgi:phage terminase large subunit GpA-like protein